MERWGTSSGHQVQVSLKPLATLSQHLYSYPLKALHPEQGPHMERCGTSSGHQVQVSLKFRPSSTCASLGCSLLATSVLTPCSTDEQHHASCMTSVTYKHTPME